MDAITLLKEDHQEVSKMFKEFEGHLGLPSRPDGCCRTRLVGFAATLRSGFAEMTRSGSPTPLTPSLCKEGEKCAVPSMKGGG